MVLLHRFAERDPKDGTLTVNWSVDPADDSRFCATFSIEDGEWAALVGSDRRMLTVDGPMPGTLEPFDVRVSWKGPRKGPLRVEWAWRGPSAGVWLWLVGRSFPIVRPARQRPFRPRPMQLRLF